MQIIGGKKYYTVDEAARLAGVSVRTLRRWLSSGRLSDFLYPFRITPNALLYRLEEPEEGEEKNARGEWTRMRGGDADEGGSRT